MARKKPIGVVLAGGRSRRMGGSKATADLGGRPLIAWPLETLRAVLDEVVVVAKHSTALPPLDVPIWVEPDEPRHPLAGVVHALRMASARRVVVLACDMPLVPEDLLRTLLKSANDVGAITCSGDVAEPLCAVYTREALKGLEQFEPGARATDVVEALGVAHVEWGDANAVLSVNAPEDLLRAQALL
jgi:molybdenum cofactor guanylyltransferase